MDVSKYIKKKVKVELSNGYFYKNALVLPDTTDETLEIQDRDGKYISINVDMIILIQEVEE